MINKYTTKQKRTKALRIAAIILAVILAVSSVILLLGIWEKYHSSFTGQNTNNATSEIMFNGEEYVLKENIETVLVLGLDKFEGQQTDSYNNNRQADFLMLLVIDHNNSKCSALHINRDTMALMPVLGVAGDQVGTVTKQIALAHTYGNGKEVSCRNTADTVSWLLHNVAIDHYISVTMDAVPIYNDLLGGVEVEVLDDFTGVDDTLIKGETVTLMGEHALNYVRTRYGLEDSSNSHRMVRQQQYIKAVYKKTLTCLESDANFAVNAGTKLADYVVSDYTINGMQQLAQKLSGYEFTEIYELEGENVMGEKHIEFYPDENALTETVVELFYDPKK